MGLKNYLGNYMYHTFYHFRPYQNTPYHSHKLGVLALVLALALVLVLFLHLCNRSNEDLS